MSAHLTHGLNAREGCLVTDKGHMDDPCSGAYLQQHWDGCYRSELGMINTENHRHTYTHRPKPTKRLKPKMKLIKAALCSCFFFNLFLPLPSTLK